MFFKNMFTTLSIQHKCSSGIYIKDICITYADAAIHFNNSSLQSKPANTSVILQTGYQIRNQNVRSPYTIDEMDIFDTIRAKKGTCYCVCL